MKKIILAILTTTGLVVAMQLQSCNKLSSIVKTPDVSFSGASTDVVIPPTSDTTEQLTLSQASFSYNIDSMIKSQTSGVVGYGSITSIKIKSITLSLSDADAANNFANFIIAGGAFNTDANGGNYPTYTVGAITNNPDTYSDVLSIPVTDSSQDIKKYFQSKTTFYYLVVGKLRRPTTHNLHCHIDITYDIAF